jgi:hypothetical protein
MVPDGKYHKHIRKGMVSELPLWLRSMLKPADNQLFLAAACLFVTGLCLARLSHLIFLNRLMAAKKWLRRALLGVTAFNIVGSSTIVCCFVFACQPISKSWNVSLAGKCIDRTAIFIAVAVQNIVADILLIALPAPIIYELHLPRAQKFRFTILLGLICV